MIALFDWPEWYDGPRTAKQATVLRRFLAWVDANPAAVASFIAGARALLQRGGRASPWRVWEHVRAQRPACGDDYFKLRNTFLPFMSRLAMHRDPDLVGRIPVRRLGEHGGHVAGAGIRIDDDLAALDAKAEIERLEKRIAAIKARLDVGGGRR